MKYTISKFRLQILIGLCLSILFVSCRPRGVLSSRQMRNVLVDLHKTDALLQECGLQFGHEEAQSIYYAQVMEQHGVTQAQFDSSLVWYTAHPQLFDKIYPKVLAQLAAEREALDAAELAQAGEKTQTPLLQEKRPALTKEQLDNMLWAKQQERATLWTPLMHDSEDKLLP